MLNKLKNVSKQSLLYVLKQLDYKYYIGLRPYGPIGPEGLRPKRPLGLVGIVLIALAIVFSILYLIRAPKSAEAEWFNDGWYYRQTISITNSSTAQTSIQVKVLDGEDLSALVTAGKLQADLDDLRFTDLNGNILKYWIEDGTNASVDVWAVIDYVPADGVTVYMYYGNASATGVSSVTDINQAGGTLSTISGYRIHTFINSETFYTNENISTETLVVAGGGGGGSSQTSSGGAGGGGAGGLTYNASFSIPNGQYNVTVGTGGASGTIGSNESGINGTGSAFYTITTTGGGAGSHTGVDGFDGGSGGGGGYNGYATIRYGGTGVAGQGNDGGDTSQLSWAGGAGGGGAGGVGGDNKINHAGGDAGIGLAYSISGSSVTYATGGTGGSNSPAASTANTGDGGDAAYAAGTPYAGANGIVIVRYVAVTTITSISPSSEEKGPGPIAYWSFDEGYGTTTQDRTSNSNDGTITGATWQTEDMCVSGKCLYFDGVDDYVNTNFGNNRNMVSDPISVSMWVKPMNSGDRMYIATTNGTNQRFYFASKDDEWEMGIQASSWNGGVDNVEHNKWTYIYIVGDGSSFKLYINGNYSYQKSYTSYNLASDIAIGSQGPNGGYKWDGFIDEVKIYPYARTAAQILTDYNTGLAGVGSASGISVAMGGQSKKSLSDGLVAYWKMDEASWNGTAGEVIDSSGNENHGIAVNGATTTSTAKFAMAGAFDGINDRVDVSYTDLPQTSERTYSWWHRVNANGTAEYPSPIAYGAYSDGFRVLWYDHSDDTVHVQVTCGSDTVPTFALDSSGVDAVGDWHHYVFTYDGATGVLYRDGVLMDTETTDKGDIKVTTTNFYIGLSQYYFNGSVDEVRAYNRALSSREAKQLYEYAPGPAGYWDFNEKEGTTAYDKSGNENNGTLTSMDASTDWVLGKYGSGLDFDGDDDSVNCGNDSILNPTKAETLEAWVRLDAPLSEQPVVYSSIISRRDVDVQRAYFLAFNKPTNKIYWEIKDETGTYLTMLSTKNTWNVGQWYHITAIFDGNLSSDNAQIYIDGISDNSATWALDHVPQTTSYTKIGNSGGWRFDGKIDEVKVYNYARTQKQILEDMNGGRPAINSPIGYWNFDEGYGAIANDSGLGKNDGIISGATSTSVGKFGRALDFDGSDDYVSANITNSLDQVTISSWILIDSPTATYQVAQSLGSSSTIDIACEPANSKCGCDFYNSVINPADIGYDTWTLITCTYDGVEMKQYVNGEYFSTESGPDKTFNTTHYIGIGRDGSLYPFKGKIDEAKIYNYPLTEDEVKQEYNQGKFMTLSSGSTESDGTTASNSSDRSYCVPGDTATCNPPIAEWKFDEKTSTTAYDTSENSNDGTLTSGPTWVRGKIGSALDFDGDDDYVDCGNDNSFGITNGTLSLWFKVSSLVGTHDTLFWKGLNASWNGMHYAFKLSSGDIQGVIADEVTYQNPVLGAYTLDKWHHAVMSWDGSYIRLYLDGVAKIPVAQTVTPLLTVPENIRIGKNNGNSYPFDGEIDQVQIYDYARTPAQIAWDYDKGAPVAYWSFDEGEYSTIHDETDNLNHGTLNLGTGGNTVTSTAWQASADCKEGKCLDFDGTDDYVQLADNSLLNDVETFSISIWAKPGSLKKEQLFSKRDTWDSNNIELFLQLEGKIYFTIQDGVQNSSIVSNDSYQVNGWNHIVASFDKNKGSNQMSLYVNGILSGNNVHTNNTPSSSVYPVLGKKATDGGEIYYGKLDETKIYNYALTPVQVQQDYNSGKSIYFK